MTIVIARRFGERIVVASDTMISDPGYARPNMMPGRVKSIVLSEKVSVAYAGLSLQAIDAIRNAKRLLDSGASMPIVEETLINATSTFLGQLEFIIVSHIDGPSIKKIWDGRISASLSEAAIGQTEVVKFVLDAESRALRPPIPSEHEDEYRFRDSFRKLFDADTAYDALIGGFAVFLFASPRGHTYDGYSMVVVWDAIKLGVPLSDLQLAERRSGATEWRFCIVSPKRRGLAIIGVLVPRAGIGFIYTPLQADEAVRWRCIPTTSDADEGIAQQQFGDEIERLSDQMGGGVVYDGPPVDTTPPTSDQLEAIRAHARSAQFPTTVSSEGAGIRLHCGSGGFFSMVLVDYGTLSRDPVRVACGTIDRLNEGVAASIARYQAATLSKRED